MASLFEDHSTLAIVQQGFSRMVSLMVIFETPFAETGFFLLTAEMVILYNHVFWRTSTNFADFSVRGLGDIAGDGQLQIS